MSKKSYIDFGDNFNFGELVFLASLIVGELVCRRVCCRRVRLSASLSVGELVCRRVGLSASLSVGELVCRRVVHKANQVGPTGGYYLEPGTLPFTNALAMQRSPQFIGYAYTPAGITLHWLRPIACQSITAGQAAALVDNERTARLLIMSVATVTTTNT